MTKDTEETTNDLDALDRQLAGALKNNPIVSILAAFAHSIASYNGFIDTLEVNEERKALQFMFLAGTLNSFSEEFIAKAKRLPAYEGLVKKIDAAMQKSGIVEV